MFIASMQRDTHTRISNPHITSNTFRANFLRISFARAYFYLPTPPDKHDCDLLGHKSVWYLVTEFGLKLPCAGPLVIH